MKKGIYIKIALTAVALVICWSGLLQAAAGSSQVPDPAIRDQITHDRGNIATTLDNFGYVGGFMWAGRPSGRWPANSGRDYLAEIKFWIGGVNSTDDTLVANTDDDFNPLVNWSAAEKPTDFLLSTDTIRYDYDATDTVGTGIGYPAYGWRVWDVEARDWVYNQVYHTLSSSYFPGGPVGVQESICRYADNNLGSPVLGLEITQTVRQWNYKEIRDIIFFTLEITNVSAEDYHSAAIGLYCDFDVGGPDPATGENGRLGDLVAYDADLDLAWTYDEDGYDPGWGPGVETGVMGTVVLSTPGDIGMTSFNTGQWEFLPDNDRGRFEMIDNTEFDESLPPTDQYYVQAVRGIDLSAGQTIQFDFALVAAPDSVILKDVVQKALTLYQNNYIASRPPDEPVVNVAAGNHMVMLKWDNTAELSIDPSTGSQDFRGYKIFRSTDRGQTWGSLKTNADYSVGPDYVPLAVYERDDFDRIAHTFMDSSLINGLEYWYAIVAYDSSNQEYDHTSGNPETVSNIIRVFPRANPLGYVTPQASIAHTYNGDWNPCFDSVTIYIVDESVITGDDYRVAFSEDCMTCWHLINTTTGDTMLADQDQFEGAHATYPIVDGFQVVVKNPRAPDSVYQSEFAIAGDTSLTLSFLEEFSSSVGCNVHFRNDIEFRFTATGSVAYDWFTHDPINVPFEVWNITADSQVGSWIVDWGGDGEFTVADLDYIMITDYDYDDGGYHPDERTEYLTWIMAFDAAAATPVEGDVLTIEGPHLASPDDQFNFSSRKIVASQARQDLNRIRVVPNPYLANARWESNEGERRIQFVNLPDQCTIRIYTLAGELIRTLRHDNGTGAENWDMVSEAGRGIASGVYLYNVESEVGSFTEKFAVIK